MALESFPIIIQPDRDVNYICNENLTFRNRSDGPLCPAASPVLLLLTVPCAAALYYKLIRISLDKNYLYVIIKSVTITIFNINT